MLPGKILSDALQQNAFHGRFGANNARLMGKNLNMLYPAMGTHQLFCTRFNPEYGFGGGIFDVGNGIQGWIKILAYPNGLWLKGKRISGIRNVNMAPKLKYFPTDFVFKT